jgi:transcription elongation GreA/GreB family factor
MQENKLLQSYRNLLTKNTAKFLEKERSVKKEELRDLLSHGTGGKHIDAQQDASTHAATVQVLEKRVNEIEGILKRSHISVPKDQTQMVCLGNGVRIMLGTKEKTYFVETVSAGIHGNVLSLFSPLGKELFGKKKGETGYYKVDNRTLSFTVLEIMPYSTATEILKPQIEEPVLV